MKNDFLSAVCKCSFPPLFLKNMLHKLGPVYSAHVQNKTIAYGEGNSCKHVGL